MTNRFAFKMWKAKLFEYIPLSKLQAGSYKILLMFLFYVCEACFACTRQWYSGFPQILCWHTLCIKTMMLRYCTKGEYATNQGDKEEKKNQKQQHKKQTNTHTKKTQPKTTLGKR